MTAKILPLRRLSLAAVLALAGAAFTVRAQVVINFDLIGSSDGDNYNNDTINSAITGATGAGVFDGADSVWNELPRTLSASNVALRDDTGAATAVTVSYTRSLSLSANFITGAFQDLGISCVRTGTVTVNGLTPGLNYDLAIFSGISGGPPTFTVDAVTQAITTTTD